MSSDKQTENSRYPSKYTDGYVTAAQYITELICEKIAACEKRELGRKFWNDPTWLKKYKHQMVIANRMLKLYSPKAIIEGIRACKVWNLTSLAHPTLKHLIAQEQKKLDNQPIAKEIEQLDVTQKPRPTFSKPGVFNKLRSLDG